MRSKIVAGNWKMNKTLPEAQSLAKEIATQWAGNEAEGVQLVLAPTALMVGAVLDEVNGVNHIAVAAQNCSDKDAGAYTGEISAPMIASTGADYVILGHSERRAYFGENNHLLAEKVNRALENELIPIYCCGETLTERKEERHFQVIEDQIAQALFHLPADQLSKVVIAYEPVWAIGTGETASPEQAQEVHAFIRQLLNESYGEDVGEAIPVLYGGSCKPGNAKELFGQKDIDGGLIGGASLNASDFLAIAHSF